MPQFTKPRFIFLFVLSAFLLSANQAKAYKTIWQDRFNPVNFVAIENVNESKKEDLVIQHPHTFDPQQLTNMLLSLEFNKDRLFQKDQLGRQVFFRENLLENKFIPPLVKAFEKVKPNQVVLLSIIQKNPYIIVRNDRLNVLRCFVAQDGLHILFEKIDARLLGDYQDKNRGDRWVELSQSIGVFLAPQEGQKLSKTSAREIILDLNYDFASLLEKKAQEAAEAAAKAAEKKASKSKYKVKSTPSDLPPSAQTESTPATKPIPTDQSDLARLKALKEAKEQGLITNHEYEEKKKEILRQW